ncbi:MAG: Na/Pi cotransporter family protein [Selenomonadaceae bacterium]
MNIFSVLNLVGGLALFLFGMSVMGSALERRAGSGLRKTLARLTDKKYVGLLTGLGITAVIQSSSATTVMVVGFVNSGLMTLRQAINVIMGANIGTTVTAWILSLSGISSDNIWVTLLKPSSFTPILAAIGVVLYLFVKDDKKKDMGLIMLGFATLMFGMEEMAGSVSGLKDDAAFGELFLMFSNPVLGVIAGAVLTAIIQSSSASVGILQVLASTGQITYGSAIPIIMGQNIGTCVTAIISSIGTNKNARRAALVHLSFNVIGSIFFIIVFCVAKYAFAPAILGDMATMFGIAVVHSVFNICCTVLLYPMAGLLEKFVMRLIPDARQEEKVVELDPRLFSVPPVALGQSRNVMIKMVECTKAAVEESVGMLQQFDYDTFTDVCGKERETDHYEDIIGTYLVNLSKQKLAERESEEAAGYLKLLADFERMADHGVAIAKCADEIEAKKLEFSPEAQNEIRVLTAALVEVVSLCVSSFEARDIEAARRIEPLDRVIGNLSDSIRLRHVKRLQRGTCSIDAGFVLSDILTNVKRVADHCSNVAGTLMDISEHNISIHKSLREYRRESGTFKRLLEEYSSKYSLTKNKSENE